MSGRNAWVFMVLACLVAFFATGAWVVYGPTLSARHLLGKEVRAVLALQLVIDYVHWPPEATMKLESTSGRYLCFAKTSAAAVVPAYELEAVEGKFYSTRDGFCVWGALVESMSSRGEIVWWNRLYWLQPHL